MKMNTPLRTPLRHALAAAMLATFAGLAAADTVSLRYAGPGSILSTELQLPLGTRNYSIGNYRIETQNPADSFLAFCVDPFQWASGNYFDHERGSLASFLSGAPAKLAEVTSLFGHAYADTVGDATKAAGFQLALWEVFNDDKDLSAGGVRTTGSSTIAIKTEAQRLLDALALPDWTTPGTAYQLTIYSNGAQQDFLSATPVPEPETAALLLAGLVLLGAIARRRAAF